MHLTVYVIQGRCCE